MIKDILVFLDGKMVEPVSYGWFHFMFVFLIFAFLFILCKMYKNLTNKDVKKLLLTFGIICIGLEIYKQINFSFNYNEIETWWKYKWYAFPFQFCSVPMYICLIAGLTKNKKLEKHLYAFLATYTMIAGIAVMSYPVTVFVDTIGINIQTMVHHGLMVVIGLFLLIKKVVLPNKENFIKALKVFLVLISIALIANIITYYIPIDEGLELFYISPYHVSSLPVFSIIYPLVPYPVFLLIYILVFSLGNLLILGVSKIFTKIRNR